MRIRTVRLHRDLAAFVLDQMNANPDADKHAKNIVKTAVERATHLVELATDLRARLGESYVDSPEWHAAMQDFRSAFTASNLPVGGPQQIKDAARALALNLKIEVPAFAQDPQPKPPTVKQPNAQPTTPAKQPAKVKQQPSAQPTTPGKASAPQRTKTSKPATSEQPAEIASEPALAAVVA